MRFLSRFACFIALSFPSFLLLFLPVGVRRRFFLLCLLLCSFRGFLLALFLAFSISHLLQPCLLLPLQSCSAKHREIAKHPPIRQEQPRARLSTPCYTARPRNSIQTKATLRTHSYSEDRSYSGGKKPHVKLCDYFDCYWRAWSCCCC